MDRKLQRLAAVTAGLGLAAAGAAASAGQTTDARRAELDVSLGTQVPGTPTGARFRIFYKHPDDPDRKPPPLTGALFELPAGTRIDGGAVPSCDATDEQFRARGRDACPPATVVGGGTLTAITGFGPPADPVETDVTAFNGGDELIELVTFKGTNTMAGIDRLTIRGNTLTAHPPATPGGPPDGRTSIREIKLTIAERSTAGRAFLTSPPACPSSGLWRSRGVFGFTDGGSATIIAATPCRPAGSRQSARLSVRPRRVRAGMRVRFRFRAQPVAGPCARGATVRFAGRRARTNRRGRAVIAVRLRRTGRRPATLSKPGCARSRASVRVLRIRAR